jgi:hypothetical protein
LARSELSSERTALAHSERVAEPGELLDVVLGDACFAVLVDFLVGVGLVLCVLAVVVVDRLAGFGAVVGLLVDRLIGFAVGGCFFSP